MLKISEYMVYVLFIGFGILLVGLSGIYSRKAYEGFLAGQPGIRCGIDLPTCRVGKQCINGFCGAAIIPVLPPNELHVYP